MGLEAAWHLGLVARGVGRPVAVVARELLDSATAISLPFVRGAHGATTAAAFGEVDRWCDACMLNGVAARASRMQGAALLATAAKSFPSPTIVAVRSAAKDHELPLNHACVFGLVCREQGISADDACRMFAFVTLRAIVNAAVRLGIIGPLEAQRVQRLLATDAEAACTVHGSKSMGDACTTFPLLDLVQGLHDRLDARLFNS